LDFAARIKELTKLIFKVECRTTPQEKSHGVKVRVSSKMVCNLFSKYWNPNEKHVPSPILLSPNTVLGAFLRGLFEGDGSVLNLRERRGVHSGPGRHKRADVNRGVKLTSKSRIFLEEVQTTLLRFSIVSRIYDKAYTRKNGYRTPAYDLRIFGRDNLQKFADNVGFISNRKQTKLQANLASYKRNTSRIYRNGDYERLVSIRKISEWKKVYDFEVPNSHAFFSNGILSHNTGKSITKDQHVAAEVDGKTLNLPVEELFELMKTETAPEGDPLGWEVIKFGDRVKVPAMDPETQQLEWTLAYGLARTKHSGKVVKIKTKNNRELVATPGHSFITEDGVVAAERLKAGMRVPIVRRLPASPAPPQTEINLTEYEDPIAIENRLASGATTALRQNRAPMTIPLNPESAWFFGFFVAEGNTEPRVMNMSVFNNNTRYVHKAVTFLKTIGFNPNAKRALRTGSLHGGMQAGVNSKAFIQFLRNTTVETAEKIRPGWASYKVPDFIFSASSEVKRAFLKGLWDGGGRLDDNLGFVIGTSSSHLAQGVMTLAESVGCFPSVHTGTRDNAPYYTIALGRDWGFEGRLAPHTRVRAETVKVTRAMIDEARSAYGRLPPSRHDTRFYRKYVASFYPEGGNVSFQVLKERADALKSLKLMELAKSNVMWDVIERIEVSDYDGYVYDFEVPGSETFVAGFGNMVTHNTHIAYLVAELAGLPIFEVNCGLQTSVYDLFGRFIGLGKSNWVDGQIVSWCRQGGILYLDEANMMKQDVATRLNPILDTRGHLVLNEKDNEIIDRNKRGYVIISMNPFSSEFAGTKPLNAAFRRRMSVWLNFDYLSVGSVISDEEVALVAKKAGISKSIATKIVEVGAELRKQYKSGDLPYGPSVSDLYNWATLIADGLTPLDAAEQSVISLSSDDAEIQAVIRRICTAKFG
jgi:nitric oxide reductase NorQ protein